MSYPGARAPIGEQRTRMPGVVRALVNGTLAAVLLCSVATSAYAAPAAQDEPSPLLLGEMARATLAAGESVAFELDLPEETLYVITSGDDAEAAKIDLRIERRGNEIYSGPLETLELELDNGDHVFTATANEDAELSLFVTGQIGALVTEYGAGEMVNGGFVTAEGIEETLYANLEIERTNGWQRGFLIIEGGENDSYNVSVSGEEVYAYVDDSATEGAVEFWTRGGDYTVQVDLVEGADGELLTLVPLLSGPLPALALGEEVTGELTADSRQRAFRVAIEEPGREVRMTLSGENEDVDIELVAAINPMVDTWGSYRFGSDESISFVAPQAGDYFVRLYTNSEVADPAPFTLLVEMGESAQTLAANELLWGTVPAGEDLIYALVVPEGTHLLSLALVSGSNQDLDLGAEMFDAEGRFVSSLSSSSSGATEIVAATVTTPGTFEVRVEGRYASEDAPFALDVRLQSVGEVAAQWAVAATASTEFGSDGYSAMQATGAPTLVEAVDSSEAWASEEADGTVETLELTYANPVIPTGIRIFESYNPGAVILVEALDLESDEWVVLWEGEELTEETIRTFSPPLEEVDFRTSQIRLTIDSDLVPGWNEIDAVQLLGLP